MSLETVKADTINLKAFDTIEAFHDWIANEKGIILLYLNTVYCGGGKKGNAAWHILATYSKLKRKQ